VTCGVWDTSRPRYVCSPWHEVLWVLSRWGVRPVAVRG
jgi:hypothetical protein